MRRAIFKIGNAFRSAGQQCSEAGLAASNTEAAIVSFSKHRAEVALYDKEPTVSAGAWVAPSASVIGEVTVSNMSAVWYNAVLRADVNEISIGGGTNIQDGTVIGVTASNESEFPGSTVIGDFVTIGPACTLHACTVESEVEVGAGSVICDSVLLETKSKVAPGSVVAAGQRVPSGQLWGGSPAEYVRDLDEAEMGNFQARRKTCGPSPVTTRNNSLFRIHSRKH